HVPSPRSLLILLTLRKCLPGVPFPAVIFLAQLNADVMPKNKNKKIPIINKQLKTNSAYQSCSLIVYKGPP
ncbi:hypothetical protein ACT3T8_16765, partial [Halomonas sp. AOP1-B1-8]|uniref:hypothetical protein n=1 Tax=Halomonas sp. AOP1-B1-8 TaxID=3457726 RepID=UPI0040336DF3